MKTTPRSNRIHISIIGRRNVGKSSLLNAIVGQDLATVSEIPGTTTDPVYKSIEILPLGPCVLIDTAGLDDTGILGQLRIQKTQNILLKSDLVLIVVTADLGWTDFEDEVIKEIKKLSIPFWIVLNKIDLNQAPKFYKDLKKKHPETVAVSSKTKEGIKVLKEKITTSKLDDWQKETIVSDLLVSQDLVMLVTPIDESMPKNRLILPQVQVLRELLDIDCDVLVTKETELKKTLNKLNVQPKLVITDSQVFKTVAEQIPEEIPLTSFSILFARFKGDIEVFVRGCKVVSRFKPGDRIFIAEACTHHSQKNDIGRVKIPKWLQMKVGGNLIFDFGAGGEFPEDCSPYKLIVHCGACMINRRQTLRHIYQAQSQNVPITNYGVLIAYLHGILPRVLEPLKNCNDLIKNNENINS
jgi:[FeFe] hydrogenase H-cluster maturation GTPase HydF